jgi:hypothetical protein
MHDSAAILARSRSADDFDERPVARQRNVRGAAPPAPAFERMRSQTFEKERRVALENRAKVVHEVLQTEREYVRDLSTIIDEVLLPLQSNNLLDAASLSAIFNNLSQVCVAE